MQQRIRWFAGLAIVLVASFAHAATILTTVDSVDVYYTSLQLNGGKPVISYFDGTSSQLRVATCTANCQTATPTWVFATVDSGVTAFYNSLQLDGGNPVISYHEANGSDLKLATCTAACQTATPTWVVTTVDSVGNVGSFDSLQLNGSNPVIAYSDATNLTLKLATCSGGCQTATPTWVITTVDNAGNVGAFASMQLNAGKPVMSYYDAINNDLKLATCTGNCQTATPTWVITTVDSAGDVGYFTSLQLNGGNPVISYFDSTNGSLKLATCTNNCQTATPTWVITTADAGASVGANSLQLNGGNPVIGYWEQTNRDLKVATCTANCQSATPTWVVTAVESVGDVGEFLSMQLNGGDPAISYRDGLAPSLKLAMSTASSPAVTGIVRAGPNPTALSSVNFTVTFSESVTGVNATDFTLTTTGLTGATVIGVTGGGGATWTVTVTTGTGSGTLRLDLVDDDSIVGGAPLGGAGAGNGSFTTGEIYTLDRTAPAIATGGRSSDGNYATGQSLDVSVTFDKAVAVDTAGGTPFVPLTIGAATRNAAYVSGSGTATLTFRYVVQATDQDLDGIAIANAISVNGGMLRDALGNDAALTPLAVSGSFASLLVNSDVTPNAFTFTAMSGQTVSTVVTSNIVTIAGIDFAVAISVTGGAYSIGCTATFTTAPGTVANGDTVCLRHTTSPVPITMTSTVLTVGGASATFSTTTGALSPPTSPTITTITPGAGQATLAFTPPAFDGGSPIASYTATCAGFSATGVASPLVVTGLANGTTYSCSMSATTLAGTTSPPSASMSVTPRTLPGAPAITSAAAAPGGGQATIAFSAPVSDGGAPITAYTATCGAFSANGAASPIAVTGLTNGTTYSCSVSATNAAGTGIASAPASVMPVGVPGAPTNLTATPGNAQATLAFAAPASNGGSTITGYLVTCGGVNLIGPASPITLTGLTNATTYSCTVAAINLVGTGPPSAPASVTPLGGVPGAPTIATATPGNGQATLTFFAPASNGGSAITSYTATCGSARASGVGSPITVTGLTNGTAYSCTVTATNAAGNSPASAPASVTPLGVPGVPTMGRALPGNAEAIILFAAPASNGGSAITGYIATCGSVSASGTASPIIVTGLTNGTTYSCSVTATNAMGTGPASSVAAVTPSSRAFSAISRTGATITLSFTGGGATCFFSKAQLVDAPADSGIQFAEGLLDFSTTGCTLGALLSFEVEFSSSIRNTLYFAEIPLSTISNSRAPGAPSAKAARDWQVLPATITDHTVTFTLTDGGLGDSDATANGSVVHLGGPGFALLDEVRQVPTLSEWGQLLLMLLLLASGAWTMRRRTR